MDADDLALFEHSIRAATTSCSGEQLDAELEKLGWHDALADDAAAAVSTLFRLQGQANATSSALGHVVRDALGGVEEVAVVLPPLGSIEPPGRLQGQRVRVIGYLCGGRSPDLDRVMVVAGGMAGTVALADLSCREIGGMDPALGLVEVTGEATRTAVGPADWTFAVARAQLAVGHELVGASRTMLELARQHALDRIQFGQPIAKFQAVRHRLAETLVAIELADALLVAAWDDGLPQSAAMAKAAAGRSARTTARHCQQVLAGIGFTTEHDLHRYVRRVFVLDQLFGSSSHLTTDLGRELLDTRALPPLLPL